MGPVSGSDEVFRIENPSFTLHKIIGSDRIHVMDHQLSMNVVTWDSEITGSVSKDNQVANMPPLAGTIELLIDPSIETEGGSTNLSPQRKIVEPIFEA
jgi:hypothetical protein